MRQVNVVITDELYAEGERLQKKLKEEKNAELSIEEVLSAIILRDRTDANPEIVKNDQESVGMMAYFILRAGE